MKDFKKRNRLFFAPPRAGNGDAFRRVRIACGGFASPRPITAGAKAAAFFRLSPRAFLV